MATGGHYRGTVHGDLPAEGLHRLLARLLWDGATQTAGDPRVAGEVGSPAHRKLPTGDFLRWG
eukprot:jgi/Mesvir1/20590/Mv25506-RA.1